MISEMKEIERFYATIYYLTKFEKDEEPRKTVVYMDDKFRN